ncbi:MAG: hypothetical protein M5U26_15465 [Planctomycetota bacterium]|nr:hypothetical protein [Planctomycetota bacterium]
MQKLAHRPLLRFHLSTLLVLSFAAGALLWANVNRLPEYRYPNIGCLSDAKPEHIQSCGVPISWWIEFSVQGQPQRHLDYEMLAFDLLAGLALLSAVAMSLEWRARRRPGLRIAQAGGGKRW